MSIEKLEAELRELKTRRKFLEYQLTQLRGDKFDNDVDDARRGIGHHVSIILARLKDATGLYPTGIKINITKVSTVGVLLPEYVVGAVELEFGQYDND